jgi:hypothetical protein
VPETPKFLDERREDFLGDVVEIGRLRHEPPDPSPDQRLVEGPELLPILVIIVTYEAIQEAKWGINTRHQRLGPKNSTAAIAQDHPRRARKKGAYERADTTSKASHHRGRDDGDIERHIRDMLTSQPPPKKSLPWRVGRSLIRPRSWPAPVRRDRAGYQTVEGQAVQRESGDFVARIWTGGTRAG